MNASPAVPVAKKPKSLGAKIFIGCLIFLLVLGLVLVVLMVAGGLWFFSPGKQVELGRLVAPEAEAVVRLDGLGGDVGFKALVTRFVTEAQAVEERKQGETLPEGLGWLEGFRKAQNAQGAAGVSSALEMYLPREAVLSFEREDEDGALEPLFVANFQRFVRPVRFFLEKLVADSPKTASETYRGRKLLDLDDGPAMTFEGGTLLVAGKMDTLKRALDRLDAPQASHPLLSQLDTGNETGGRDWDVAGVSTSPASSLALLGLVGFNSIGDTDPFDGISNLRWSVDAVSDDEGAAELAFSYSSPEAATLARSEIEARWAAVAEKASQHGLTLAATTAKEGSALITRLELSGLTEAIRAWMVRSEETPEEVPVEASPEETANR